MLIFLCNKTMENLGKSSMENILRLILEKVIMPDRHMSDGQLYLFLQLFFNTEKISLN